MTAEKEIKLSRMCDSHINSSTRRDIPTSTNLISLVSTEEPGVMFFLNSYHGNTGLVFYIQHQTSPSYISHLTIQHLEIKQVFIVLS